MLSLLAELVNNAMLSQFINGILVAFVFAMLESRFSLTFLGFASPLDSVSQTWSLETPTNISKITPEGAAQNCGHSTNLSGLTQAGLANISVGPPN